MKESIKCPSCGESWDSDTPGFIKAKEMLKRSLGNFCPSCEHVFREKRKKQQQKDQVLFNRILRKL